MAETGAPLRVTLLTEGDPGQLTGGYLYQQRMAAAAQAQKCALNFVSLPPRSFLLSLAAGQQSLRRLPPSDAIVVDSIVAASLARSVGQLVADLPLVALVHQQPGGVEGKPMLRYIRRRLDLLTYRRASAVIATSHFLEGLLTTSRVAAARIAVVPPGRDPVGADQPRALPNLRHGRQAALLCVSNWTRNKSIELALEAVAHLKPEIATLHLVGRTDVDPAYSKRLRLRLAADDLRERVVVHGSQPPAAIPSLLQAADILVHPSRHEAYGAAVAEAMAAGVPVVGFRIDNLPYLVREGADGILVPFGDIPAMAAALALLIRDQDRREAMGASARMRAMGWPTWAETAEAFFSFIRQVVDQPNARSPDRRAG